MSDRHPPEPPSGVDHPGAWDDALCRLEDVLLAAPFDRALPALGELLDRAEVPLEFVHQDDRAIKLIREAMLARPLAERGEVRRSRLHVEMMALEVEVLTQRLRDPATSTDVAARATSRLTELSDEVKRLRNDL